MFVFTCTFSRYEKGQLHVITYILVLVSVCWKGESTLTIVELRSSSLKLVFIKTLFLGYFFDGIT